MNYKSYPKSKDTPNRKTRKSLRYTVCQYNRTLKSHQKTAARRLRRVNVEEN